MSSYSVFHSSPSVTTRSKQKDLIPSWELWPDSRLCQCLLLTLANVNMLLLADCWTKRPHSLLMFLPDSCSCFHVMCGKVCLGIPSSSDHVVSLRQQSFSFCLKYCDCGLTSSSCMFMCRMTPADKSLAAGA